MSKTAIILALIFAILMLSACGGGTGNTNTANSNTLSSNSGDPLGEGVKDNAEELATLIKLPFEPEEVTWKEITSDRNRKVLAVIRFTPEDSKKIVEHAAKIKAGESVSIPSERWFPAELVSQAEMSGDDQISATAYPADEFYQAPYSEGRLSRFQQSDFFILELTAK
ncbi:MAG: hypothetical protein ABIU09_09775 [Pyrinomonadaceae bacterium]